MKKTKFLLLLGFVFGGLAFALPKEKCESAKAEEPAITLEFEDLDSSNELNVLKRCTNYFPATISEHFKAPLGSIFELDTSPELLNPFKEEVKKIEELQGVSVIPMVDVVGKRKLNDVYIYSDSGPTWDIPIEELSDYLSDKIKDIKIYEVEEKTETFEIGAEFTIEIYTPGTFSPTYHYTFDVPTYTVKPYENGDLIKIRSSAYLHGEDQRITVLYDINEDIFDDEYGFKTDNYETEEDLYSVVIINKDTNAIIEHDNNAEIHSYLNSHMTVYARLSFYSDGKLYNFYSNELMIEEQMPSALLDGYDNRSTIGLNDELSHTLKFRTTIPLDKISQFTLEPYYVEDEEIVFLGRHSFNFKYKSVKSNQSPFAEFESLDDSFFEFPLNFEKTGEYLIRANIYIQTFDNSYSYYSENVWNQMIKVEKEEVKHVKIEDSFDIDVKINDAAVEGFSKLKDANSLCCIARGNQLKYLLLLITIF